MQKRVAIYCRYSDPKQAKRGGVSSASQLKELRAAAREADEIIVAELIDQARTATETRKRHAYQQLIELAQKGLIDRVRIEDVSRGNRNELDRRLLERDLSRYNVELVYLGEDPNASPDQLQLQRGVKGVMAEHESYQISQRVYRRTRFKAEQGKWRGGVIPYGLIPDGEGWFVPDERTFPYLLHLLERRAQGWGYRSITKELNTGISLNGEPPIIPPTPGTIEYERKPNLERIDEETGETILIPKEPTSPFWGTATISNLCKQAAFGIYAGIFEWGKTYFKLSKDDRGRTKTPVRYEHEEPIIPADLVVRVRAVEEGSSPIMPTVGRPTNLILRPYCGLCGTLMYAYTRKNRYWSAKKKETITYEYAGFRCATENRTGGTACQGFFIASSYIEEAVFEQIVERVRDISKEDLYDTIQETLAAQLEVLRLRTESLKDELRLAEEDKASSLDALKHFRNQLRSVTLDSLAEAADDAVRRVEELQEEMKAIAKLTERLRERAANVDLSFVDFFKEVPKLDDPIKRDTARRLLSLLVERIIAHPDPRPPKSKRTFSGTVEVVFREDFAEEF